MTEMSLFFDLRRLVKKLTAVTADQQELIGQIQDEISSVEYQIQVALDPLLLLTEDVRLSTANGDGDECPPGVKRIVWQRFQQWRYSNDPRELQRLHELIDNNPALNELPHN